MSDNRTKQKYVWQKRCAWLLVAIGLVVVDQYTKALIVKHFVFAQPYRILPVLNFTLVYNRGAAYGFLSNQPGWQLIFFSVLASVASIGLLIYFFRTSLQNVLRCSAVMLIVAGAIGNLIDRISLGYVVDFIQLHIGPYGFAIFNFADACITVGVICLLISFYSFRKV